MTRIVGFLLAGLAALSTLAARPAIDPERYLKDVRYLASKDMKGRGAGTPELDRAARYIATQFRATGLTPLDGRSFFQSFTVTRNARLGSQNSMAWSDGAQKNTLRTGEDFRPFNFSSRGTLAGRLVFAGYGITAAEYNYDDYAGLDVKDKIVVVLRHEPQEFDEKSVFAGKIYTVHAQFSSKAANAKMHGARGLILVNDRDAHRGDADELERFGATAGPADAGIPCLQVKAGIVERWLASAGQNLEAIQEQIDKDLQPRSLPLPSGLSVQANVDVRREQAAVQNVAGYLPGEQDEYVVIGAHYDHLGLGEQFSLAPSQAGTVHPGADDNASGTAGLIELARWFAVQPKHKRGVLFIAFAGEELGLLGSSFYVNNPALPLGKAVAMINLDMIGRPREGKVFIGGTGTGSNLRPLLNEIVSKHSLLKVDFSDTTGYGSSDHTSFTTKQVPVLFFFSGLHSDYHKPGDVWEKIDGPGSARLLELVADVGARLSNHSERPLFVRVKEPASQHAAAGSAAGRPAGSGYGPYFGSIPDFGEVPRGVKFADVRDGSPAAIAGVKAGDILVEFDGKPVENLHDFTYLLRSKKPGDKVTVRVLRGESRLQMEVVLAKRT